jgi:hypothetical protein
MRLREAEQVSTLAPVIEQDNGTAEVPVLAEEAAPEETPAPG